MFEVSLRTPVAHACIEAIRKGCRSHRRAGGLTRPSILPPPIARRAIRRNPGLDAGAAAASRGARFPVMPGIMTPTELISARNLSFTVLKLFPAEQAGRYRPLASVRPVFPDVLFCASGGITSTNAINYLALANVACVAASWVVPLDMLASARLARESKRSRASRVLGDILKARGIS